MKQAAVRDRQGAPTARKIQVMDVASGVVTTLVDSSPTSYDSAPAWSPDGRQIAFESTMDGDREIYVMNADGTNVRQLTHNTLWDEGPAWSPDGTQVRVLQRRRRPAPRHLDDERRRLRPEAAHDLSRPRRVTGLGREPAPGAGRRDRARDALAAARLGASFGAFTPGVDRDYTATSTGTRHEHGRQRAAVLLRPGHLMNGTFALPEPLRVAPSKATWSGPVSNDALDGHVLAAHRRHRRAADRDLLAHADVHAVDDGAVTFRKSPSTACSWPAGTCTHEPAGAKTSSAPWVSTRSPSSAK